MPQVLHDQQVATLQEWIDGIRQFLSGGRLDNNIGMPVRIGHKPHAARPLERQHAARLWKLEMYPSIALGRCTIAALCRSSKDAAAKPKKEAAWNGWSVDEVAVAVRAPVEIGLILICQVADAQEGVDLRIPFA